MELIAQYEPWLVIASILVAIVASYAALDLAGRITVSTGQRRLQWLAGGSLAMGIGIWSMHFIAMLAFRLPVPIQYSVPLVVVSAAFAVAASLLALWTVSRARVAVIHLAVGGLVMGPAIAGMHYIGMAAMLLPAHVRYDPRLWTLSVIVAIVVSWAALWLALRFRGGGRWAWRAASAVVMGFAVVGMHYTGMAAAHFMPDPVGTRAVVGGVLATQDLAAALLVGTFVVLGLALLSGTIDRRIAQTFVAPLRESEARLRQLAGVAEATSDYVGTTDAEGRFLYLNGAGRVMLGVGLDEDVTTMVLGDVYTAQLRDELLARQGPVAVGDGVWRGETLFRRRDGRTIPVSLVALVHRGPAGTVEFLSGVARDVSEQVATRDALHAAREAAERIAAAKGSFLANMSHEIRTPMNGILGMVELLQDTDLTPEQRRSVDVIAGSGEALLAVINEVLDLSKIEAGSIELEAIAFDLPSLVDATVRLLASRAFERNVELACDIRPDVPNNVRGDPGRLRQVLTNLVGNAIKFTHKGEVVISVGLVRQDAGRAQVAFAVRDTGIGIAPEHLASVFRPFGQADASTTRKYGGTGLGLSISRRLVELMGGTIELSSTLGAGSTFRFELDVTLETHAAPPAVERPRVSVQGQRALVVDDNATNRRIVQEILALAALHTDAAADVDEALRILRAAEQAGHKYDLVVSDVHMPGRDGFGLATVLRAEPGLRDTRIMLLTSGGERGDAQRCRALGIAAYLLKPVSRIDLLQAALSVLGGSAGPAEEHRLVTRHSIQEARRGLRILLAEDNPVNQEVAAAMLRKRGHRVDIVADGRQAVDAAMRHAYDVVLMDLQMPEMDGLVAAGEIRRLETGRRVPIVALTANVMDGERERCLAGGMDEYLSKPFKAHELFAAVEGWVPVAPPATPAGGAPAVDVDAFRAELRDGGIEDMLDEMLQTFRRDAPARLDALERAVGAGEANPIARAAHAFKSSSGAIRARGLTELLKRAEIAAQGGDVAGASSYLPRIVDAARDVITYIETQGVRPKGDCHPGSLPA